MGGVDVAKQIHSHKSMQSVPLLYLFGAFGLQTGVELTTVSKHGDGKTWPGTKRLA